MKKKKISVCIKMFQIIQNQTAAKLGSHISEHTRKDKTDSTQVVTWINLITS